MAQTTTLDELIGKFEVLLFDSDGVLARWPGAVPGAPIAVDRLNSLNEPYFVSTNDASALPETLAARNRELGSNIDADRIITAGSPANCPFLRAWHRRFEMRRVRNERQRRLPARP